MTVLTCSTCAFDADLWSDDDLTQTIERADRLIAAVLEGAPAQVRADADRLGATNAATADDRHRAVHAVMHRLYDLSRLRGDGEECEPMHGTVASLHASGGGVPKLTTPGVEIGPNGIVGDVQNDRIHHGRPWQAVCLYSTERLDALADEGHPVAAGCAGENITVSGLDWDRMRGGLTVTIGEVVLRTSMSVTPCHKIGGYFIDRDWNRIHEGEHPGWARWYASVITPGRIDTGATVTVSA